MFRPLINIPLYLSSFWSWIIPKWYILFFYSPQNVVSPFFFFLFIFAFQKPIYLQRKWIMTLSQLSTYQRENWLTFSQKIQIKKGKLFGHCQFPPVYLYPIYPCPFCLITIFLSSYDHANNLKKNLKHIYFAI